MNIIKTQHLSHNLGALMCRLSIDSLKKTALATTMILTLFSAASPVQANLITNGEFDAQDPLVSDFVSVTPTGWVDAGNDGPNGYTGQNFLELFDGLAGDFEHPMGGQGNTSVDVNDRILQQMVSGLTPGASYLLEFLMFNQYKTGFNPETLSGIAEVLDGAGPGILASDSSPFLGNQETYNGMVAFIAPVGGSVTVQFRTLSSSANFIGVTVDDVSLVVVPEPSAYLTLSSLLGIGLRVRRRATA